MDLAEIKRNWEVYGSTDPLQAILTIPRQTEVKWDVETFFATGIVEVNRIMKRIDSLSILPEHQRALDFGCGVGRLTQPLGAYFGEVVGVDISSSMIALAKKLNTSPNCHYKINQRSDLGIFPDNHFDFAISLITLQHMEPKYAKSYLREVARVLRKGGVAYFGVPERLKNLTFYSKTKARLYYWLAARQHVFPFYRALRNSKGPVMEMHGIPQVEVERLMSSVGAEVEYIEEASDGGNDWLSYHYCIRKL
ncbi:MAG: methyltransferase domain-containing protein [Nitrososphaerota archaeon]|nr:methyltransferase domain-containing protein [Nitrososphaerota archaeon]